MRRLLWGCILLGMVLLFCGLVGQGNPALAAQKGVDQEAILQEAQGLQAGAEGLLSEAEAHLQRAARLNEQGKEQQALDAERKGMALESKANALRLQAEDLIQSARTVELEKRREGGQERESFGKQ
jgi:hypothetical protein